MVYAAYSSARWRFWRHHQRRRFRPFALSLIAPGAGFLLWAQGDGESIAFHFDHRWRLVWRRSGRLRGCGSPPANFPLPFVVWLLSAVTPG